MAKKNVKKNEVITEAIEAVETIEVPETEAPAEPTGPAYYLYVKAARDNTKLYWDIIPVEGFKMGMTFKEIEGLIPNPVREGARNIIFVAIDRVKAFIEEGKTYGIKTTNKDFTKNYNKIMRVEGTVAETTAKCYGEVLEAYANGTVAGEWVAPVTEAPEENNEEVEAA